MSYQKQAWHDYDDTKTELQNLQNGAVVTPERMNHIETGIANAAVASEVTAQLAQTNNTLKNKDENTINAKSNPFINAVGNGVSTTIQEAYPDVLLSEVKLLDIDADLNSQADWYSLQILINKSLETGKPLHLPKGHYHVDRPLKYSRRLQIKGVGESSRILSFINNGYLFEHSEKEESSEFVRFENFYIEGSNHTGTGGGIFFKYGGHSSVIRDMWIKYFQQEGQTGVYLLETWYTFIDKCDISNNDVCMQLGHETDGVANGIVIRDTRIDGRLGGGGYQQTGLDGILAINSTNIIISGCLIENHNYGVRLFSNACVVENCHFEANSIASVYSSGAGNVIKDSYFYHNRPNAYEVTIRAEARANVVQNLYGFGFNGVGDGGFVSLPLSSEQGGGHVVTNIAVADEDLIDDDNLVKGNFTKNKVSYFKRDGTFIDV